MNAFKLNFYYINNKIQNILFFIFYNYFIPSVNFTILKEELARTTYKKVIKVLFFLPATILSIHQKNKKKNKPLRK